MTTEQIRRFVRDMRRLLDLIDKEADDVRQSSLPHHIESLRLMAHALMVRFNRPRAAK